MCENYRNKTDKRQYYPSKLALWELHCFENIIEWSNDNLTTEKIVALQFYNSSSSAMLCTPFDWDQHRKRKNKDPFKIIPIHTKLLK